MASLVVYHNYLINSIGLLNNTNANGIIDARLDNFVTMPDYKPDDIKKLVTALKKGTGQMPDSVPLGFTLQPPL